MESPGEFSLEFAKEFLLEFLKEFSWDSPRYFSRHVSWNTRGISLEIPESIPLKIPEKFPLNDLWPVLLKKTNLSRKDS